MENEEKFIQIKVNNKWNIQNKQNRSHIESEHQDLGLFLLSKDHCANFGMWVLALVQITKKELRWLFCLSEIPEGGGGEGKGQECDVLINEEPDLLAQWDVAYQKCLMGVLQCVPIWWNY